MTSRKEGKHRCETEGVEMGGGGQKTKQNLHDATKFPLRNINSYLLMLVYTNTEGIRIQWELKSG